MMEQPEKIERAWAEGLALAMGALIFMLSLYAGGYYAGRQAMEAEAVSRGYGQFVPRGNGTERFVWRGGEAGLFPHHGGTEDTEGGEEFFHR